MSKGDITRLNRLYQCPGYEINLTRNNNETFTSTSESPMNNLTALELDDDKDDMVLSKEQVDTLFSTNSAKRNGLKSAFHHWPNGVVPFEIDTSFSMHII